MMTIDEFEKWYCERCSEHSDCPYVKRDLQRKCSQLNDASFGYEVALDQIEKEKSSQKAETKS